MPMNDSKTAPAAHHTLTAQQAVEQLETDPQSGLSADEAQRRLSEYGRNKLQSRKQKSILAMFLSQLNDALIYVLMAAVGITMLMGEYVDGFIIIAVILINATLGVVQEVRAGNAIDALRDMATPKALVKRDTQIKEVNSEEIVPGDLVILDAGRYIPADLRLIESANLQIDESALTGESVAVEKDANKVFSEIGRASCRERV